MPRLKSQRESINAIVDRVVSYDKTVDVSGTLSKPRPDTESYRVISSKSSLQASKSTALFLDKNGKVTKKATAINNVSNA